ncbi:MAG: EexN family lipoprotein [Gammaproteobacteria bacterium]
MQKNHIIVSITALLLILSGFTVINAEESAQASSENSVAWYVANIKEAKAKNQECHDNPSLQSSSDCANALHALEISFKGGN